MQQRDNTGGLDPAAKKEEFQCDGCQRLFCVLIPFTIYWCRNGLGAIINYHKIGSTGHHSLMMD